MTEKRFVLYEHKGADYILDTPNTELDFIEMLGDTLTSKEIVDLLNALHEENQSLKFQLNECRNNKLFSRRQLEKENEQLKEQWKEKRHEDINELSVIAMRYKALEKENEQLKKVIEENEKLIQSTYEELTKLRCIKKNLERIKAQWDWIMEAIQYD